MTTDQLINLVHRAQYHRRHRRVLAAEWRAARQSVRALHETGGDFGHAISVIRQNQRVVFDQWCESVRKYREVCEVLLAFLNGKDNLQ